MVSRLPCFMRVINCRSRNRTVLTPLESPEKSCEPLMLACNKAGEHDFFCYNKTMKIISFLKPKLILTIGISGSGKSTWVEKFLNKSDYVVITTDAIRKEITGNISDQSKNDQVRMIAHERVCEALNKGKNVILDATNIYTDVRRNLLKYVRENIHDVVVFYKLFTSNLKLSKSRIAKDVERGVERSNVSEETLLDQQERYLETIENIREEGIQELSERKFSIVYYLENEIKDKVRNLQQDISDLTGAKASLVEWEPHITVGDAPEVSEEELQKLETELEYFSKNYNPYPVTLDGYGGFAGRIGGIGEKTTPCVLWIDVIPNEALVNMVANLKNVTNQYSKWWRMSIPYNPHATLAFRDLDQKGYEKGNDFLQGKSFVEKVIINHIALVEHLHDKDLEYKRFYFNK